MKSCVRKFMEQLVNLIINNVSPLILLLVASHHSTKHDKSRRQSPSSLSLHTVNVVYYFIKRSGFFRRKSSERKWKIKGRQNINLLSRSCGGWRWRRIVLAHRWPSIPARFTRSPDGSRKSHLQSANTTKCRRMKRFYKLYSNKLTVKVFYDFLLPWRWIFSAFGPKMEDD